jgi:hypothetical protein
MSPRDVDCGKFRVSLSCQKLESRIFVKVKPDKWRIRRYKLRSRDAQGCVDMEQKPRLRIKLYAEAIPHQKELLP